MPKRDSRGFTLLEAVVALAILGLAGVGALEALGGEVRGAVRARAVTTAAILAQDRLAMISLLPRGDLDALPDSVAQGEFQAPVDDYHWTAIVRPVLGETDLYELRVVVTNDVTQYSLTTRVYRPRPRGLP